jgi:hypothetical protein
LIEWVTTGGVTGLFDLMEAHFGHAESDLSRMFCFYVGVDRPDLARVFVATYSKLLGDRIGLPRRFTPFVIHDRAIVWEWRQRHPAQTRTSPSRKFQRVRQLVSQASSLTVVKACGAGTVMFSADDFA